MSASEKDLISLGGRLNSWALRDVSPLNGLVLIGQSLTARPLHHGQRLNGVYAEYVALLKAPDVPIRLGL